ncbi:aspartyl/glutamyl-tRNA amidotransferase subunit A [Salinibacter sp. 10B]|uniref:amidase family protein n=1 Tax=Salinibacter sp. 10B TaxID=1923971 RepID=UPI000CF55870|nr:amidase family protein [Salinibacter sp. 10B]PQJ35934.1 aspartyl/glutamyl-tRNA amidotransferase subunit A [Salinibacter sp. 10B]
MDQPTFAEAHRALDAGETTCEALVSSFLDRIDDRNDELNAFTTVDRDGALNHARYLDSQRERGNARPLSGLVLAVKDNICIRGYPVSCGSKMLKDFSSLYDATVIERLRDAGAIFIGKTNCDEFAMGSSNETSHFGPVRNPHDPDYVPGGSSGGSAAAVAAGMCHAALGSDTGGSVRQPSAFCGVVGLKPTYGRVSRSGLVAFASSLDVIGPLANSVEDVATLLNVMAGEDPNDSSSAPVDVPDYTQALTGEVEGLKVGLPDEYFTEGLDPTIRHMVRDQVATLEDQGAEIERVSLPHTEYGVATYYLLATAEASSNLARYDGIRYGFRADLQETKHELRERRKELQRELSAARTKGDDDRVTELEAELDDEQSALDALYTRTRTEGFGDEVKRRIMLGTYALSAGYYDKYYEKAQRVRTLIRHDFDRAFEDVDVLVTPTTPTPPFQLGEKTDDPLEMYLNDIYTVTANLAGIPGLTVPIGSHPETDNLPVGLQLLGPHFDESVLLQVGDVLTSE